MAAELLDEAVEAKPASSSSLMVAVVVVLKVPPGGGAMVNWATFELWRALHGEVEDHTTKESEDPGIRIFLGFDLDPDYFEDQII